jgi:hypothetical protein
LLGHWVHEPRSQGRVLALGPKRESIRRQAVQARKILRVPEINIAGHIASIGCRSVVKLSREGIRVSVGIGAIMGTWLGLSIEVAREIFHDGPETFEELQPVVDIKEVKPFRSLEGWSAPFKTLR